MNQFILNSTKMSFNVDVTKKCNKKTYDIQLPAELSYFVIKNCPHCSLLYLLTNKLIWNFQISCRVHQVATVSASARKKFLYCADADTTLAEHFCEMKSLFLLKIIPCPTCLFWA